MMLPAITALTTPTMLAPSDLPLLVLCAGALGPLGFWAVLCVAVICGGGIVVVPLGTVMPLLVPDGTPTVGPL